MPARTKMFFSIACVCLGVALLLYLSGLTKDPYVTTSDVRNVSVVVDNMAQPLTYEEQTLLLKYLNRLKPLDPKEDVTRGAKPTISKILIYHYKDMITEVYPILYLGDSVIIQSPDWNEGVLLKDTSHGEMKQFFDQLYSQLQKQQRQTPQPPKEK